jgi:hypothetical protein
LEYLKKKYFYLFFSYLIININNLKLLTGSLPSVQGCWVGLNDKFGNGTFLWEESINRVKPITVDRFSYSFGFYDWRRDSRSNISVTNGVNDESNQRCVNIHPWTLDPLSQEQGSMKDGSCGISRAFVCQMLTSVNKYTLTSSNVDIVSGEFIGGSLVVSSNLKVNQFNLNKSALLSNTFF